MRAIEGGKRTPTDLKYFLMSIRSKMLASRISESKLGTKRWFKQ